MRHRPAAAAALALLLTTACASPGASGPASSDESASSAQNPASEPQGTSAALPSIETEFPPACGVVTAGELSAIIGNPLADGSGFTSLICDWGSDPEETSASLLLQPLPTELCPDGLPDGEATDQFGSPASIHYDDLGDIPGAQVGVCVDGGLVLVTITGGVGAASDPPRYTSLAVEVMELVLERL
jgi:hypothetical protein